MCIRTHPPLRSSFLETLYMCCNELPLFVTFNRVSPTHFTHLVNNPSKWYYQSLVVVQSFIQWRIRRSRRNHYVILRICLYLLLPPFLVMMGNCIHEYVVQNHKTVTLLTNKLKKSVVWQELHIMLRIKTHMGYVVELQVKQTSQIGWYDCTIEMTTKDEHIFDSSIMASKPEGWRFFIELLGITFELTIVIAMLLHDKSCTLRRGA